jgi:hypothetical protein
LQVFSFDFPSKGKGGTNCQPTDDAPHAEEGPAQAANAAVSPHRFHAECGVVTAGRFSC